MHPAAVLSSLPPNMLSPAARVMVLADGIPEPRLAVVEVSMTGPLDIRSARVSLLPDSNEAERFLTPRWLTILASTLLADESVRHLPLIHGRPMTQESDASSRRESTQLVVQDEWASRLQLPLYAAWRLRNGGLESTSPVAKSLRTGMAANRSWSKCDVHGDNRYVIEPRAARWSVASALESLFSWAEIDVSLRLLPPAIAEAPILEDLHLRLPLGDLLERVLSDFGLIIRRELRMEGDRIVPRIAVVQAGLPGALQLRSHLTEGRRDNVVKAADQMSLRVHRASDGARRTIARAARRRIESTFPLVPAWDPALESGPDSGFSPATNVEFNARRDVYRLWALNHDARLTPPPFSRGEPFDIAGLFGVASPSLPDVLRFEPCLIMDVMGLPVAPVIEVSLDSGAMWIAYPGHASVLESAPAVLFDDVTLPAAFLVAARAGTARVRVTATLQGPPLESSRWTGNHFAGRVPDLILTPGDAFESAAIHPDSIHSASVVQGVFTARTYDDADSLDAWLAAQFSGDRTPDMVRLPGIWPTVRVGDRIVDPLGQGFQKHTAPVITAVEIRFSAGATAHQPGRATQPSTSSTTVLTIQHRPIP